MELHPARAGLLKSQRVVDRGKLAATQGVRRGGRVRPRFVDTTWEALYNQPHKVEESRMSRVEIRDDEPLEKALRRFKRLIEREGILKALKAEKHYEKPSERQRRELRQAMSRRARSA